ncbi:MULTISPECIES: phage tail protein [Parabacteroides]|uniref:Tail tube protein n=1 Tax=Myoviridae sp. ctU4n16 TaxID=2826658 RepID=A0A8S5N4L4_9CAUD|nr:MULTISPECIES: phage tail protein [Parabacteroides]MCL3854041.1 phage tail protein [Parabacteroides leei]DAD89542.1 MAG TPA: tail tube protein [Myoviridae sp. ctU4n16]
MAKKQDQTEWIPPVEFHFRVDFQWQSEHFKASFMEVQGLNMQLQTEEVHDDSTVRVKIPKGSSHGNITLKRSLEPLSEPFTEWMNECFGYLENRNRKLKAYDMVIKLLDKDGNPLAGWLGRHAYPIQWDMSGMNAMEGKLVTESIVMACNSLKRITNIR